MSADPNDPFDDPVVHEVVIVGAGYVGSLLAEQFAIAGVNDVVVLEAGNNRLFDWSPEKGPASSFVDERQPMLDHYFANQVKMDNSAFEQAAMTTSAGRDVVYAPSPMLDSDTVYFDQPTDGRQLFDSIYMRMVGGTSYHWLGIAMRLLPNDFRVRSLYGVGVDWPISYEDLEPWYTKAEYTLGVSGDDRHAGAAWRSAPFPMPPIPQSYHDKVAIAAAASDRYAGPPIDITPPPVARNSVPYDGRPPCAGSNNCTPICPIQAKHDASVHLKRALGAPDAAGRRVSTPVELRVGALVTDVVPDPTSPRRIDHLLYRDATNGLRPTRIRAKRFILAIHAVEIPKLLLKNQVANSSDQLGRNLMDHPCQLTSARTVPVHPFRGPLVTSTVDNYRDGSFRSFRAASRTEFQNIGWTWTFGSPTTTVTNAVSALLAQRRLGRGIAARIADDLSREVTFDSLLDQLPDPNNRVTLSDHRDEIGIPRPKLTYTVDDYTAAGGAFAEALSKSVMTAMGADPSTIFAQTKYAGAGHHLGTHRMGADPRSSVTDSFGAAHDHDNLHIIGGGSFPTVGTANPTLTLVALTLRSADRLVRELTGKAPTS